MQAIEAQPFPDTGTWLKARRGSLGASDVPSLYGLGYQSELALWVDKRSELAKSPDSELPEQEFNLRFAVGHAVEPVLAQVAQADLGHPVVRLDPPVMYRRRDLPGAAGTRFHCTPDALVLESLPQKIHRQTLHKRALGLSSFKSAAFDSEDWPEDAPHPYALLQIEAEMLLTGLREGWVTALFGLGKSRTMPAQFHESFASDLVERVERFWEHVQKDVPPAPRGTESDARAIRLLFPRSSPTRVFLGSEWGSKVSRLAALDEQISTLETEKEQIRQEAQLALGEAQLGIIPGYPKALKWATQIENHQPRPARTIEKRVFRIVNPPKEE